MLQVREKKILEYLLSHTSETVTTTILANEIGCSDRTIKTTIKNMNQFFVNKPYKIETKSGKGIWLSYDSSDLPDILYLLQDQEPSDSEEWQKLVLLDKLLNQNNPISLQELADSLYTNVKNIQKYLDINEPYVNRFGVKVLKKAREGISLQGNEIEKRHLKASIIKKKSYLKNQQNLLYQLKEEFPMIDVKTINQLLGEVINNQELSISDYTFYNILIHTVLAMERVPSDYIVSFNSNDLARLCYSNEWKVAKDYSRRLSSEIGIDLPDEEVAFLTVHFLGAKVKPELEEKLGYPQDELSYKLYEWIEEIGQQYGYPLTDDLFFLQNLYLHLKPLLNRLQYGVNISNPWVSGIKKEYSTSYEMAVEFVSKIESDYSFKISEADIGFIALHMGASVTRLDQKKNQKVKVLIVCASGIGMSHFLKVKLEQLFFNDIDVLDTVSSVGTNFDDYPCDFILSTIPLDIPGKQVIQISPILDELEQEKIKKILHLNHEKKNILLRFLFPELIIVNDPAKTWQEAIKKGVDCLIDHEFVTEGYYLDVMKREELSHTAIGNGLAIPHGDSKHVVKEGIACITLEKPVLWGEEKVDIIFLLAVTQKSKALFSELFIELSNLSVNKVQLKQIKESKTPDEIVKIIIEGGE